MSLTEPNASNDYLIPLDQVATRDFFQLVFSSVGERLRALELTEVEFQAVVDQITTQALQIVSANITTEIDTQRAALIEIEQQADAIVSAYEDLTAGLLPAANATLAPIPDFVPTNVQDAVSVLVAQIKEARADIVTTNEGMTGLQASVDNAVEIANTKQAASGLLTALGSAVGALADRAIYFTSATAATFYTLTPLGRTLSGLADLPALLGQIAAAGGATLSGLKQSITGGFRTQGKDLGNLSGTIARDPGDGNLLNGIRTGTPFTIAPLTHDGFVELFFWSQGSGAVTISGAFENSDKGDSIESVGTYHCQLRRTSGGYNMIKISRFA